MRFYLVLDWGTTPVHIEGHTLPSSGQSHKVRQAGDRQPEQDPEVIACHSNPPKMPTSNGETGSARTRALHPAPNPANPIDDSYGPFSRSWRVNLDHSAASLPTAIEGHTLPYSGY